jgi:hypothetical protein
MIKPQNKSLVVFSPRFPQLFNGRKRFFVTLNTMSNYIGSENAHNLIIKLEKVQQDKTTWKFRNHGKLEIYWK